MIHCNIKNKNNKSRPTFYIDENEIRAGGILFYRYVNHQDSNSTCKSKSIEVLLSLKQNRYEDIGGKTDSVDQSIFDTISREVQEETNGLITSYHVQKQLQKQVAFERTSSHYIIHGKYLLYIIQANSFERKLSSLDFGETELLFDIPRTMHWIPIEQLSLLCLHPRLPCKQITTFFSSIQKNVNSIKSKM